MSNIERGVWHKDGPVAQIRSMVEWLGTPYERPDDEHIGKVQTNLGAAADALEGAVGALERIRDHANSADDAPMIAQQALNEIRGQ